MQSRSKNYQGQRHQTRTQEQPRNIKKGVPSVAYQEIKKDYSLYAEKVIKELYAFDNKNFIKTNQLRNIYSLISPFFEYFNYNKIPNEQKSKDDLKKIKIKIAYQIGRDKFLKNRWELGIKPFNDITNILELIDIVLSSNDFMDDLKLYCNYFEALIAFHRYYEVGGNK